MNTIKLLKVATLVAAVFIANGCMYQSVDITDIMKAEQFCKDKGGVKEIDVFFTGYENIFCKSGAKAYSYKIILKQYANADNDS